MPVGKKLGVVLSIVVIGVSAALFFRKDGSAFVFWSRGSDDPFAQQVERRVGTPAWTPPGVVDPARGQAQRVPQAATASIAPAQTPAGAQEPRFRSTLSPVAALLPPIEGVVDDVAPAGDFASWDARVENRTGGATRHVVEDGDTLTRLAAQYLGRPEAYLEIFNYNRDVLSTPDLLPIGAVLKIPPRRGTLTPAGSLGAESSAALVPVPPRP